MSGCYNEFLLYNIKNYITGYPAKSNSDPTLFVSLPYYQMVTDTRGARRGITSKSYCIR